MRIWKDKTPKQEFDDLGTAGHSGALNDRQYSYLVAAGYSGSLADMIYAGSGVTPVANQTAAFGADTLAGDGGYTVVGTDVTDLGTGTASGYTFTDGVITPTTNGSLSAQDGNTINVEDGAGNTATVTLSIVANALHVAAETTTTERAAAIAHCAATPATDWTIYMRPGSYGTVGGLFAITTGMSGAVTHSNTDMAARIADPALYTYDDTASFSGGSILFKANEGAVTWQDRTQLNAGADAIGWEGTITFSSGQASTPIVLINGSAATTLGDFLFKDISMQDGAAVGQGIQIAGANRVVVEDCEFSGLDNPINHLGCIHFDMRRTLIWDYENDAASQRNETKTDLGDVTMYVTLDNCVIADRATGVSHADSWQGSSIYNQLPVQHFISGNVFGPYAQGFFIGDTGNTYPIEVDGVSGGTPAVGQDYTYAGGGEFRIRSIEDLGAGNYRWVVTRGDVDINVKGDFTMAFPADNDTLTSGAITASMNGTVTKPLIYGGVVFDNFVYSDFGQGINVDNMECLVAYNTVVRFADDVSDDTAADSFISADNELVGAILSRNVASIVTTTDADMGTSVDIDATLASGATSYDTVFDNSDKTWSLNADGQIVPSTQRTRNSPSALRAYMEATFATSQTAGANKTLSWTKPVLSSATITSVSTDTGNGRLFWVVGTSGLTLNANQIANGDVGWSNGLPTAGSDSGYIDVSATGTQTPSPAPTVGAGESVYWCHVADAGGVSAVSEVVGEVNIVPNSDFDTSTGWTMATGFSISGGVLDYDGTGAAFGAGTYRADCNNDAGSHTASIWIDSITNAAGALYVYYFDGATSHLMGSVTLSGATTGAWVEVGTQTFIADTNGQISIKHSAAAAEYALSAVKIVAN